MPERAESLSFDRVADEYDATRGGEERGELIAAAVAPHLATDTGVLEIGVGTGVVAAALRGGGVDVVGLDLSPAMLARARERLGPRVAVADAERLPVADAAVGAAYAVWVLHLVADIPAVLAEAARVLRPGGRLVVVPGGALGTSGSDVTEVVWDMWRRLQPHGRPDDPDRVVRLAAQAGLRLLTRGELLSAERATSPAQAAAAISGRSFSVLWEVDDRTWSREVEPLLARLRALPDQDRPRTAAERYALLVFERA